MESKVYNQSGKEVGEVTLPEEIFGVPWNGDVVHQVYTSMMLNRRQPIAHAKTRGEVSGGGKKPWKQKGTGRARHGSTRSPLWVGGGVTHGPRNDKIFSRKVNKQMKRKALAMILSKKYKEGEVLFIDSLTLPTPKTKEAKRVLENLSSIKGFERLAGKKQNAAYITLPQKTVELKRGFSNFSNITLDEFRNLNPVNALQYTYLIVSNLEAILKSVRTK